VSFNATAKTAFPRIATFEFCLGVKIVPPNAPKSHNDQQGLADLPYDSQSTALIFYGFQHGSIGDPICFGIRGSGFESFRRIILFHLDVNSVSLDVAVRPPSRNKKTLLQNRLTTLRLWNSDFQLFRPVLFIRMHPAFPQAFRNRHCEFWRTCCVSKGANRRDCAEQLK